MKKNLIIEGSFGADFTAMCKKAKNKCTNNQNVQFEFNGIICIVSLYTDVDYLFRDYLNAFTMEWKTVGPDCVDEYDSKTLEELGKRKKESERKAELQREEWRKEEEAKLATLNKKIGNIILEVSDPVKLKECQDANTDPYEGRCVSYAIEWGKLMQYEMSLGKELKDIAESTSRECDYDGITGFMYGAAVNILSQCWKHGETLSKWHNKEYNHEGDGVVNPAVLTIES